VLGKRTHRRGAWANHVEALANPTLDRLAMIISAFAALENVESLARQCA
jgi:hypothetical protein